MSDEMFFAFCFLSVNVVAAGFIIAGLSLIRQELRQLKAAVDAEMLRFLMQGIGGKWVES